MNKKKLPCGRYVESKAPLNPAGLERIHVALKNYLADSQLKYTEQRWDVAKVILQHGEHIDAQEAVTLVRKAYPQIGAATVYRTIKLLVDAGLLEESLLKDGRRVFEQSDSTHHDHMVCLDCGHIFEFHSAIIEKAQQQIARDSQFTVHDHRHIVYVKCDLKTR